MRTGSRALLRLGWGEAAVVAAVYLLPPGLVPALFLVGVALTQLIYLRIRPVRRHMAINNVATLVLASGGAAVAEPRWSGCARTPTSTSGRCSPSRPRPPCTAPSRF